MIFAKQHQESKEKLIVQRKPTSTNQCCYFTLQNETLSEPTTTLKVAKFHKKTDNLSLLVHSGQLSTAVIKVDIKVINPSLSHDQCLQCVPLPGFNAMLRYRDATER